MITQIFYILRYSKTYKRIELHKLYLLTENFTCCDKITKQIKKEKHEKKGNGINDSEIHIRDINFIQKLRTLQGPTINDKLFSVTMFLLIHHPHMNLGQLSYAFWGEGGVGGIETCSSAPSNINTRLQTELFGLLDLCDLKIH